MPEDLETYCDLGLRIPFSVQLKEVTNFDIRQHSDAPPSVRPMDEERRIEEQNDRLMAAIRAESEGQASVAALNKQMYVY